MVNINFLSVSTHFLF